MDRNNVSPLDFLGFKLDHHHDLGDPCLNKRFDRSPEKRFSTDREQMLGLLFGERPEPFSTTRCKYCCLQPAQRPFRTCLKKRSVSFITLVASDLSFDSPVTRITGSVPLSRTRTQAFSVLTLNPNFVSAIESFPRIFFKPEESVEIMPLERILGNDSIAETKFGLRVSTENAWVLVRDSGTEPVIRVTGESKDRSEATRVMKETLRFLRQVLKGR